MAVFTYEARDRQGRAHQGSREAATEAEVADALRREGLFPMTVGTSGRVPWYRRRLIASRPRRLDVEMQLKQLSFMLQTGLSLLQAIRILVSQRSTTAAVWESVEDSIRSGSTLKEAMEKHRCFSRLTCSLVDVGERSGSLDLVLSRASDAMQGRRLLKTQVVSALAYPVLVVVLAIGTAVFMLVKVVPKLATLIAIRGSELPPSTQALLDISALFQLHALSATGVIIVAIALFAIIWASAAGRKLTERLAFRLPIVGKIMLTASICTFARNTALLLSSGVRITAAMTVVAPLFGTRLLQARLQNARQRVVQGESLSVALDREHCLTSLVHGMVSVGESSGTMDEVLIGLADHHDEALKNYIGRLGAIIEPLILIVVGSIVGFIYFAFFSAVYSASALGSP